MTTATATTTTTYSGCSMHQWRPFRLPRRRCSDSSSGAPASRKLCVAAAAAAATFTLGMVLGALLLPLCGAAVGGLNTAADERRHPSSRRQARETDELRRISRLLRPPTERSELDDVIADSVFWSDRVEALLPAGFSAEDARRWTAHTANASVRRVSEGCGRMQNRLLLLEDGTRACSRSRQNHDQIQGDIFSFHLSRLLGLGNVPPSALSRVQGRERQWAAVRGQLALAQWDPARPVVLSRFLDGLVPAFIPRHLRGDSRRLHPLAADVGGLDAAQLSELAQWSDLVVFDYLTANLDRVVNNMFNEQWNADMMSAPAHNLARDPVSGLLVFLDNESGLLHGYRLLDKYETYHRRLLDAVCVFRRPTVDAVRRLLRGGADGSSAGRQLQTALRSAQPEAVEWLPPLPDRSAQVLRERLVRVEQQVRRCQSRYAAALVQDGGRLAGEVVDTLGKPD